MKLGSRTPSTLLTAVLKGVFAATLTLTGVSASADSFRFMAIGDMPYHAPALFDQLIQRINVQPVRFTIHVGDFKAGSTLCDDQTFDKVYRQFMAFDQALIYTPGDNEWTDCHRKNNGGYDPLERLQKLRQRFFTSDASLGQHPLKLELQSSDEEFRDFSENRRWSVKGVSFATIHMVGSNNNLQPDLPSSREFAQRNAANIAWMRSTFASAKANGHVAVVLAMQADTFQHPGRPPESGVAEWVDAFREEAAAWRKPVLLIQGDTHQFKIDRPFEKTYPPAGQVQRVVVPGEHISDAVLIAIDTDHPEQPFAIRLLGQ